MLSFIFCMTWWFAFPAYIRDPNQETLHFYPIFTVFNSWTGVFVFCLLGVVSKPFRATLFGSGGIRVSQLAKLLQIMINLINAIMYSCTRAGSG